jgi:cell division protein FtsI/penicillin-binding protein 2
LGFVGIDNTGLEGIEYKFESHLSGKNSNKERYLGIGEMISGANIVLTIDKFVQHVSENEIERAVKNNNARQGMVLVLDTENGHILSMAKFPNFDSNYYYNYSKFSRRNFTVIDSFEPGSTLKIIALSALIEDKPSIMKSIFRCEGKIDIADATINCTGVHGTIGITDIVRYSCNVGIIEAMRKIKKRSSTTNLSYSVLIARQMLECQERQMES